MTLELYSEPSEDYDAATVARAREFAQAHVSSHAEDWERTRTYPEPIVRAALADFGSLLIPKSLGGEGARTATFYRVLEEFAKHDIGFSLAFVVQCNIGLTVATSDNARLRERYLPGLMKGAILGAFCLTEPQAGSDVAAIDTIASGDGDEFAISGKKAWVIGGAFADIVAVFAKTRADPGTQHIALFLADTKRSGLEAGPPYELVSANMTHVGELVFDRFKVRSDELLFPPGVAFKAAMRALDAARIGIAAICNGALTAGLAHSLSYAAERTAFGSSLLDKQGVQWSFADHLTRLEASRLLTFKAASLLEQGQAPTVLAAHAKKFANHAVVDGLVWAMRSMGAHGTLRKSFLPRQLGSAQLLFHTDGTPEVLNLLIGRALTRSVC